MKKPPPHIARADELVHQGTVYMNAGNLPKAITLLRQAAALFPKHPIAHGNLGVALIRSGDLDGAQACYQRAIACKPDYAHAHNNLGTVLREKRQYAQAEECYRRAVECNPDYVDARRNLLIVLQDQEKWEAAIATCHLLLQKQPPSAFVYNTLGKLQKALGQTEQAKQALQQAMQLDPSYFDAYLDYANLCKERKEYDQAEEWYQKAIVMRPDFPDSYNNLGTMLQDMGRNREAEEKYRQAMQCMPSFADPYNNLATLLQAEGRFAEAEILYRQAIERRSFYPMACNNLGNLLKKLGRWTEAESLFQQALAMNPRMINAINNLALLRKDQGDIGTAETLFRQALAMDPNHLDLLNNLAILLKNRGGVAESRLLYERALAIHPGFYHVHNNLGNLLKDVGDLAGAIACYRQAVALRPNYLQARVHLIHMEQKICYWGALEGLRQTAIEPYIHWQRMEEPPPIFPFLSMPVEITPQEMLTIATHFSYAIEVGKNIYHHERRVASGRLKIGYLSADFHNHATAHLMLGLFRRHDRSQFEIYAYSLSRDDGSIYRKKIMDDCDHFVDLMGMDVQQMVERIYHDKIDILVDLKGYTLEHRADILAYRPAPVQVTYLGYPGTMGAKFIDYVITDQVVTPPEMAPYYSEKMVYMPHCYQVNDQEQAIASERLTRAACGLPESGFVFCCFNNHYKLEPGTFGVWMAILQAVPGSVLWMIAGLPEATQNLRQEAVKRGVDPDRLIFAPHIPKDRHLARHIHADLFLDTFYYNAHTTASDALWAGVPVITVPGLHFASRVSKSLLLAVGMPELIMPDFTAYQEKAIALARSPADILAMKEKLNQLRLTMPLFDTNLFTQNLEKGYKMMWERWEQGLEPEMIYI